MARLLPPDQWFASLPTAYLAAAGLITDTRRRVLMVSPNYREHWTLPGGVVEHAEAPHTACEREIAEEVGLQLQAGELLAVQWSTPREPRPKAFCSFVFDCGTVADGATVDLQYEELDDYAFLDPQEAVECMHPALAPRLRAALDARTTGRTIYVTS